MVPYRKEEDEMNKSTKLVSILIVFSGVSALPAQAAGWTCSALGLSVGNFNPAEKSVVVWNTKGSVSVPLTRTTSNGKVAWTGTTPKGVKVRCVQAQ